jgi:hypothetical protein
MSYETNIFKIENLHELSDQYVLFEIQGLNHSDGDDDDDDYEINIQHIIRRLSYSLKHPVTVINRTNNPRLVVRNVPDVLEKMPMEFAVKRNAMVQFNRIKDPLTLDFVKYDEETKGIILRFLQFDIQTELNTNGNIWQPGSGDAFFNMDPAEVVGKVGIHSGFLARVVDLPGTLGFGISIDVTKKYVSQVPEEMRMTRASFKKLGVNQCHLVYNYGGKRYELKAHQISDQKASEYKFPRSSDGEFVTLLADTQESFKKLNGTMPPEVATLPDDASVLVYMTNDDQERGAIAGLCYRVFDTEDPVVRKIHRRSIMNPFYRRRLIRVARLNYFKNIKFGKVTLKISEAPIQVKKQKFIVPDAEFGNGVKVSIRGTSDAEQTTIEKLGGKRRDLLDNKEVGFYSKAAFRTQYFVVPQTLYNMYCNDQYFLKDLTEQVDRMHETEKGWRPIPIPYDDRGKNAVDVGFEILQKIKEKVSGLSTGGYAVVMLPSGVPRVKRKHDEMAAMIVTECTENYDIQVGIMHSDTLEECFIHQNRNGISKYVVKGEMMGKYKGYVRGVAINQVLLNNEQWPYILHTPLHADLTIGIDVKRQVAGFTFIDKYSKNIFTRSDKSNNWEKLSTGQVVKMLVSGIQLQVKYASEQIRKIVIHRDGRIYSTERAGIEKAIKSLQDKGVLPKDVVVAIIEIPKHTMASYRMFEPAFGYDIIKSEESNGGTLNPEIGSWLTLNSRQALLCTTGREFNRNGSSNPLFVNYASGSMSFENILEDLYYLSTLAYTKPDDCSRLPLTLRLTDRKINNLGSEFDFEALEIQKSVN